MSALHACPDCRRPVSPRADSCPECGARLRRHPAPFRLVFLGLGCLALAAFLTDSGLSGWSVLLLFLGPLFLLLGVLGLLFGR